MVIACCHIEIHLPTSSSLKEKRKVIGSLRDRLRRHYNVSFAEVEHQDLWQRAGLALVGVAAHRGQLDATFRSVQKEVQRSLPGEMLRFEVEYL